MAERTEQKAALDQELIRIKGEAANISDAHQKEEIISAASTAQSELSRDLDIQKIQDTALQLRQKLALALGKPMPITPVAPDQSKETQAGVTVTGKISEFFEKQKAKIEAIFNAPLKTESLVAILKGIKEIPVEESAARGWTIRVLLDKLRRDGHLLIIGKNNTINILPKEESLRPQSVAFAETFKSYMDAGFIGLADLDQALLVSSGSMTQYVETQPEEKRSTLSRNGYRDFLLATHKIPKDATPESIASMPWLSDAEKAFLASSYERGENVPLAPIVKDYQKIMTEISAMPGMGNASKQDKEQLANGGLSGKPFTMAMLGIGGLFALGYKKGEGFSLWTGLQRAFMVILVGLGVTIGANEWGYNPKELLKDMWASVKENGGKAADAAADAAKRATQDGGQQQTPADGAPAAPAPVAIDKPKNLEQATATEKVRGNATLVNAITKHANDPENGKERGSIEHYLNFINSPAFQSTKLDEIMYGNNADATIFRDTRQLPIGFSCPDNLDPFILKRVIRAYLLSGTYHLTLSTDPGKIGTIERERVEKAAKGNKESLKDKTIGDIIKVIYQAK